MKKVIAFLFVFFALICNAQNDIKVTALTPNTELNYIISNLLVCEKKASLYNGAFYVDLFLMSDSKATPSEFSPESCEILYSFLVSIKPDGDYYSWSKLYKIEGMYDPKIVEIIEIKYPSFYVKIEHGAFDDRNVELFEFSGSNMRKEK